MRIVILTALFLVGLLVGEALAACVTHTYIGPDGGMVICTTCCYTATSCTTTCF